MCFAAAGVFVVGSRPSPYSLDASVANLVKLEFPPLCAVQGCKCFAAAAAFVVGSGGPSPCSFDASVASFVTLALPPLCAVQGCMCFAAAGVFVVGSRLSPCSLDTSATSFVTLSFPPLCAVQGCASALLQPLPFVVGSDGPSPCSLARGERRHLLFAGVSTAVRGSGLRVLCCSRCPRRRL